MVVLRTLAALAVAAAVSMASPLRGSAKFSIPGPLAMSFGNKVVPQDNDVTLTALPPKLGTFKRLPGSSYTAVTVQPYGILVDSMDSTLLWLQNGLKPAPVPSNFETSDGFYRVYELLNDTSPVFPWTPSNLQGPEHASVLTLLFDTSNITPQDQLYLQNAAMNPSRFNFINAMEHTSLSDKVAAGALFLATTDATNKPSPGAKVTFATLLDVLNMPQKDQTPMLYRRASETEASAHSQESDEVEIIIEESSDLVMNPMHVFERRASKTDASMRSQESEEVVEVVEESSDIERRASETDASMRPQESEEVEVVEVVEETSDVDEASPLPQEPVAMVTPVIRRRPTTQPVTVVQPTQTVTTTVTPLSYYPMIVPTDCPDSQSSASRNRMTVFGLVSVAAILFAI